MVGRHTTENDTYVTKLELRHPRVIRTKGGRTIKHVVDHNLEEKLSQPFFFIQDPKGEVTRVFYPHDDSPDLVGIKKGILITMTCPRFCGRKLTSVDEYVSTGILFTSHLH